MAKTPESRRMGQTFLLSLIATCLVIAAPFFVEVPAGWVELLARWTELPRFLGPWSLAVLLFILSPVIFCAFAVVFGYLLVGPFKGHGPGSRR